MAVAKQAVLDEQKLMQFVFRAVDEVGATLNAALVVMGDKLGLYRALAGAGPLDPGRARRAHRHRRALRPRVAERPGGGRLRRVRPGRAAATRCRRSRRSRSPTRTSPAYLPGFFQIALGSVLDSPRITEAARTGDGRRLARARPRRVRRLRALLPPGLQRQPGRRVAAGARRRRREARARARASPTSAAATAPRRS